MKNDREFEDNKRNNSSLCCSSCRISTDRLSRKESTTSSVNKKENEELTEECPLKKDQSSSESKLNENWSRRRKGFLCCLLLIIFGIIATLLFYFFFGEKKLATLPGTPLPVTVKISHNTSTSVTVETSTTIGGNSYGAVVSDYSECSQIGVNLLQQNGNAVDAAIATTICMSVVAPHKTGLGGGGRLMIYSHADKSEALIIDFANNTNEGIFAAAKVRVPAFLRGLEFAQSLRGHLPWHSIVEPAAKLARDGFRVSNDLASEISKSIENGMIFGDLVAGELLQLPVLAETLEAVGRLGSDVFYNGSLSHKVVRDAVIRDQLLHQLSRYEPQVLIAKKIIFYNHTIYLSPEAKILRSSIEDLNVRNIPGDNSTLLALSLVKSVAADNKVLKKLERERYSGVVAVDVHETYVSIVTGLSSPLGLTHMTGAGFLLDGLGDENHLEFLTPIVFHDERKNCGLRGVFGLDDPSVGVQVLYNLFVRDLDLLGAIEYPRFHVLSDGVAMEYVDSTFRSQVESLVPSSRVNPKELSKSVNGITKDEENLSSHADSRGGSDSS